MTENNESNVKYTNVFMVIGHSISDKIIMIKDFIKSDSNITGSENKMAIIINSDINDNNTESLPIKIDTYTNKNNCPDIHIYDQVFVECDMNNMLHWITEKFNRVTGKNHFRIYILCMINADNWKDDSKDAFWRHQIQMADIIICNGQMENGLLSDSPLIRMISTINPIGNILETRLERKSLSMNRLLEATTMNNKKLFREDYYHHHQNDNQNNIDNSDKDDISRIKIMTCEQPIPTIKDFERWYQSFIMIPLSNSKKIIAKTKAIVFTMESTVFLCRSLYDWYEIKPIDNNNEIQLDKTTIVCITEDLKEKTIASTALFEPSVKK